MPDNDLEKLKKKIYKPGDEVEFKERLEGPEVFNPEEERERLETGRWQKTKKKELRPEQKKKLKTAGIWALVVFFVITGFLFWRGLTSFDKDKVNLEIRGAERIVSGDEVKYVIKYKNETKLDLTNLKLVFRYPEDSIPLEGEDLVQSIDLENLKSGQEGETELSARVIGLKGDKKKAWVELFYTPGNLSSRFSNEAEFETEIVSVPFVLDFDLPEKLVDGQEFDFSLVYSNQSETAFSGLYLKIDYPSGFAFDSSDPQPFEENNIWFLDEFMAGEQEKLRLKGTIFGEEEENKSFGAQLGIYDGEQFVSYAEIASATQISISPLFVSQTVNGESNYVAQTGESLDYRIKFKNTTDVGIEDVVITSKLEGQALDLADSDLGGGSFDEGMITWNASNLSALKFLGPGQEGEIGVLVRVKESPSISSSADKNFTIVNTVKINSDKPPLSLERIDISGESKSSVKIAGDLTFQSQAFYNDDLIPNSGPVPPKVGQKTTYTIKWRLVSKYNDLSDVMVEAYLPPHVKWENKTSPSGADLTYDSSIGQVVWQAGNLAAGTGILSPVEQVAFQISITPDSVNVGNLMELIGQSKATGQDTFAGLTLTEITDSIDTHLPDDTTVESNGGRVIQ